MNLSDLHSPADIKKMSVQELGQLSAQIRMALLKKLSIHGGHIGPNLGMVEATIALHYVFNSPRDKIVFDVSHQCYVHKMLTGRIEAFLDPKHYDDVSGFTNPAESEHDFFTIGHTSTAVSLAGGMAKTRDLKGGNENIIAIVGDGSLSGGEAFEGLDFGTTLNSNFIIVVNDNDMSIAENHGGLYDNLRLLRETDGNAECNYFKSLGYDYKYVAYGNDVETLVNVFNSVKDINHPIVVHINTQKGKGFAPAEAHKEQFHFGPPFDLVSGNPVHDDNTIDYSDIFAETMIQQLAKNPLAAVITAGTPGVLGFGPTLRKRIGSQFIDVGIAEQEAVAMASGMAREGGRPCFGVVSSFIQRAYDQMSQDVAINNNPIVLNIFYGSLLGMNDVTHLGWFDIALISNIPNFVYLAPSCKEEYVAMLNWAMSQTEHPVAVRVPGGKVVSTNKEYSKDYSELNKFLVENRGKDVAIIGVGNFLFMANETAEILKGKGINATIINPRFLSGIDCELMDSLLSDHKLVVTLEDGVLDGGFGEKIARYYGTTSMKVKCYGCPKKFEDRYDRQQLMKECRLKPDLIAEDILLLL